MAQKSEFDGLNPTQEKWAQRQVEYFKSLGAAVPYGIIQEQASELNENELIKVFELDFGDTNLLSENADEILAWIKSDMDEMKDDSELEYSITIRRLTRKEIDELPEWS